MSLEFTGFQIGPISDLKTEDQFGWVPIQIFFSDSETKTGPSVTFEIAVQYERSWTVDHIRQAAFERAQALLAETTRLFAQHGLEGLQQLHDEHGAAEAQLGSLLPSSNDPDGI